MGKNPNILRCPADHSKVMTAAGLKPRIRSISINCYLGGFTGEIGWSSAAGYQVFLTMNQIITASGLGPSRCWLFLDMREDVINWGNYLVDMSGYPNNPAAYKFDQDLPGFYHNGACGFSFCDGHSEIRRWLDPRTTPPLREGIHLIQTIPSPNNQDIAWMQDRTTRRK